MSQSIPQEVLSQMADLWELSELTLHRRVANFIYFANRRGHRVVLRLTETSHRLKSEIASELEWMDYLNQKGLKVVKPIRSRSLNFVEESESFLASVFEFAEGKSPRDLEIDQELLIKWGQHLGRMHTYSKNFVPKLRRQNWDEDENLKKSLLVLDPSDEIPYLRMQESLEWLKSLPKDRDSYGLVHCDLHMGNFFVDKKEIISFDYDDSCYQWYSYDMTAPFMSIFFETQKRGQSSLNQVWRDHFLSGYLSENNLPKIWVDRIDSFYKVRSVILYHWFKWAISAGMFTHDEAQHFRDKTLVTHLENFKEGLKLI